MTSDVLPPVVEVDKHLRARLDNCLRIAELSNCPRRAFGAMLYDPLTKQARGDAYNGGPRGGGRLCGGEMCLRDNPDRVTWEGLVRSDGIEVRATGAYPSGYAVHRRGVLCTTGGEVPRTLAFASRPHAERVKAVQAWVDEHFPIRSIPSGTHMEIGCHHAEMNLLSNAAAEGVATRGLWLLVTGEPCMMCAKFAHHAGIARVVCVRGGYAGGSAGPAYLEAHGVEVMYMEGPADPRHGSRTPTP